MKKKPTQTHTKRDLSDQQLSRIRGGVEVAATRENIVFTSVSN